MASRRTRIKGIANIPQRRKTENTPNLEVAKESDILPNLNVPDVTSPLTACTEKNDSLQAIAPENDNNNEVQPSVETLQQTPVIETQPVIEKVPENSNADIAKPTTTNEKPAAVPFKRRFAKPILSTNLINRKPKPKPEDAQTPTEPIVPEIETPPVESSGSSKKDFASSKSVHFALNETEITDEGVVQHVSKFNEENCTGM